MYPKEGKTSLQHIRKYICLTVSGILLTLYIVLSPLHAQTQPRISWKRVPGANAYIVMIKNTRGKIIFSKKTTRPYIYVKISPGEYKIKITVLNKFQKPESSTKWKNLVVKKSFKPRINSVSPDEVYIEDNRTTFALDGSRFAPDCTITLKKGSSVLTPLKTNRISSELVSFTLDPKQISAGRYTVILTNPGGEQDILTEGLLIKTRKSKIQKAEDKPLHVDDLLPSTLYVGNVNLTLKVFGEGFTETSAIYLQHNTGSVKIVTTYVSPEHLTGTFNPNNQATGSYDLVVYDKKKGHVTQHNALRLKNKTEGLFSLHGLNLSLGLSGNILLPEWRSEFRSSFKGIHYITGYGLNNVASFSNIIFLNKLQLEAELDYIAFDKKTQTINSNRITGSLTQLSYGANIVYAESFATVYYALFRCGGGITYSTLEIIDESAKEKDHSYDPYFEVGPAFRYLFAGTIFLETGTSYKHIFYKNETHKSVRTFFRIGIRM